jgi:hypothetical protein
MRTNTLDKPKLQLILYINSRQEVMKMAAKNKVLNTEEFTSSFKEFSKLMKETYLNTLDFSLSVAEENKKAINGQLDYIIGAEKEYVKSVKDFYTEASVKDLPFGKIDTKAFEDGVDRLIDYQKNAFDSVKGISDNVTAEGYGIAKKNLEKGFSLFDEALDSIKI